METFVWINGYEGRYKISNHGNVLSVCKKPMLKKHSIDNNGYLSAPLYDGKKYKSFRVHILVARHFVPGYKEGLQVNHKNANKLDARAENLEWVTMRENYDHAVRNRLYRQKSVAAVHKKTGKRHEFRSGADAARALNCITSAISKCCHGEIKSHGGYIWSFV